MYDITLSTLTQARYDIHCRNEDDLSKKHCRYSEYTDKKKNANYGPKRQHKQLWVHRQDEWRRPMLTYTVATPNAQTKSNRDKDKIDILLTRDVFPSAVRRRTAGGVWPSTNRLKQTDIPETDNMKTTYRKLEHTLS